MADIKQLKIGNTVYDLKDQGARDAIAALGSPMHFIGMTTTPLSDGATTNPIIINGQSVTAVSGDVATYTPSGQPTQEFIFTGSVWQLFGDVSDLGALAYHDYVTVPVPSADAGAIGLSGAITSTTIIPTGSVSGQPAGWYDGSLYIISEWATNGNIEAYFSDAQVLVDALGALDLLPEPDEAGSEIVWTRSNDTWTCSETDLTGNPSNYGWSFGLPSSGSATLTLTVEYNDDQWEDYYAPIGGTVELTGTAQTFVSGVTLTKNILPLDVLGNARDTTYTPATSTVQVAAISYVGGTVEQLIFNNLFYYGPVGQPAESTFNVVTGISATTNSVAISAAIPSNSVVISGAATTESKSIPSGATFKGGAIYLDFKGVASTHSHDIKLASTNISGSSASN